MTTVEELSDIFPLDMNKPDYHCKVFEENQSCIAVTESSKFSPQKKHIFLKYHHFKYYIDPKQLRIIYTRFRRSACWYSNKTASIWAISYFTKSYKRLLNSEIHLWGSVRIHKKITFYECFGHVKIVKKYSLLYFGMYTYFTSILECWIPK